MIKSTIIRIESLVISCVMLMTSAVIQAKDAAAPEVRSTVYGTVHGVNDKAKSGTYIWRGIPFAKPPVGDLRWKAPVEPDPWKGTLQTQKFGNACAQNGRLYGPGLNNTYDATIGTSLGTPVGSEDCLTLNIWRPANAKPNLPVILFVYGGSNVSGYSADPVYEGAKLANKANAVVVSTNYRVGIMGFINLAQLKTGTDLNSDSGNFAVLDVIQALKFINKNITNFGGDKSNVTIMGESAGAINIYAVMTSPLTEGLVHKAIPMSGGFSLPTNLPKGSLATLYPAPFHAFQGDALLSELLISDGKATDRESVKAYIDTQSKEQLAAYVRSKDAKVILSTVMTKLAPKGLGNSGPIPDGTVIPLDPMAAIAAGNYRKIPILASNTKDEAKLFAAFLALSPALGGKPGFIIDDATRFKLMAEFNGDAIGKPKAAVVAPAPPVSAPAATRSSTVNDSNSLITLGFFPFDGVPYDELMAILKPGSKPTSTAAAPPAVVPPIASKTPGVLSVTDIINPAYLPVDAPGTGWNAKTSLLTNMFFIPSLNNVMETLLKQQSNVWYFQFNWAQEPPPWNDVYGAAHAFEMPFVFGNFGPSLFSSAVNTTANKPGREALSEAMMSSIAAFVNKGDPNNGSLGVKWEPWPKRLIFDATLTQKKISVE